MPFPKMSYSLGYGNRLFFVLFCFGYNFPCASAAKKKYYRITHPTMKDDNHYLHLPIIR